MFFYVFEHKTDTTTLCLGWSKKNNKRCACLLVFACVGFLGAKMSQDGAKMLQDGVKMSRDGVKMKSICPKMEPKCSKMETRCLKMEPMYHKMETRCPSLQVTDLCAHKPLPLILGAITHTQVSHCS